MIRKSAIPAARKSIQSSRRSPRNLRVRVVTAFRNLAGGVDERTARNRTQAFYRSSGTAWARGLS
jgi:hypothetical protein